MANNNAKIQQLALQIPKTEGVKKHLLLDQLVDEMEEFVWKLVHSQYKTGCGTKDEMYQAAWIGVMRAIESYSENKGTKFTTYAYWQILNELAKYKREFDRFNPAQDNKGLYSMEYNLVDDGTHTLLDILPDNFDMEEYYQLIELEDIVKDVLSTIKPGTKRDVIIKFLIGTRPVDIAKEVGISKSYVSVLLREFRKECSNRLTKVK